MRPYLIAILCSLLVFSIYAQDAPSKVELSSSGRLRYYSAEQEELFISPNYFSIVRSTDGQLVQRKYDKNYRLIKRISWPKDGVLPDSTTEYTYKDNEPYPASSQTQEIATEQFISEVYNALGSVIYREVYLTIQAEATVPDEFIPNELNKDELPINEKIEENVLLYTQNWEYDTENRVVVEEIKYSDDPTKNEKTEYFFLAGEGKPDTFFYKNGDLSKKITYTTPSDWEEILYFPDKIEIKTIYIENSAVNEQFFQNGIKIREKNQ